MYKIAITFTPWLRLLHRRICQNYTPAEITEDGRCEAKDLSSYIDGYLRSSLDYAIAYNNLGGLTQFHANHD